MNTVIDLLSHAFSDVLKLYCNFVHEDRDREGGSIDMRIEENTNSQVFGDTGKYLTGKTTMNSIKGRQNRSCCNIIHTKLL